MASPPPIRAVQLTSRHALLFVFMSCIALVGLFFLVLLSPNTVLLVLNVFFALAGWESLTHVAGKPLIEALAPSLRHRTVSVRRCLCAAPHPHRPLTLSTPPPDTRPRRAAGPLLR